MAPLEREQTTASWLEFLDDVTLFENAIRLRHFVWTILRYVPRGSELLEVGFGSGTTAVLLADLGYRVTALDVDVELVAKVSTRYADWARTRSLEFRQGDMFALGCGQQKFDLVYHQGVLEHFQDEQIVHALSEQRRVARQLVFDVPNHRYHGRPFGDERLLPPRHWRRLIGAAGWTVTEQLGRDFDHWLYLLPHAFFSRLALQKLSWFSRHFAVSSMFVCDANEKA